MEDSHFDRLARAFGALRTRRAALLLGGKVAIPALGLPGAGAKAKHHASSEKQKGKKHKQRCKALQKKCGGKCVAIQSDERHCGACDNRCAAGQSCSNGQCHPSGCHDNEVCEGDGRCRDGQCQARPECRANGETFPESDGTHCCSEHVNCQVGTTYIECTCLPGELGNDCLADGDCRSGSCVGYQCVGCPSGQVECDGRCVSLESQSNCGACGHGCDRGDFCHNQTCTPRYQVDASWSSDTPTAVFVDATHTVFLVDDYQDCVRQYSESGTLEYVYGVCGETGTDNRHFQAPDGAVANSGLVLIADGFNDRIQIFARNGARLGSLASGPGAGNYQVDLPFEMALDRDNNIYVADSHNNRVQKFNSSGTYLQSFGSGVQGSGQNQLHSPAGVAVDRFGNVYVADWENHRVQKFDNQGSYVRTFGSHGTGSGQFDGPVSCAVASTGDLFVADSRNHRVQQFATNGEVIRIFAGSPLVRPQGVAVDDQDNLYIADEAAHAVIRFRLKAPKPS